MHISKLDYAKINKRTRDKIEMTGTTTRHKIIDSSKDRAKENKEIVVNGETIA